jgi:thioesterase domain-containing protein
MRAFLSGFFLLCFAGLLQPAEAAGHIYLLRGFAGIFSTGLDRIAEQLVARGYNATVHSYTDYPVLAEQAAAEQRGGKGPIIIIGHSFGAQAAISMAEEMKKRGASVALIVSFAPTIRMTAPSNVAQIVNYELGEVPISGGSRFRAGIANIDLTSRPGIDHFNVEKIERLQKQVVARVQAVLARKQRPARETVSTRKKRA